MRDGASINASRLAPADLGLYAVTVFVWGTSWIALKAQLGEVSPEVSTLWRFLLAAPLMWLWAAARGDTLAYPAADHRRFAAAGALMFSSNFVLFLYGGQYLPSGLLAVVFSLVSILNLLLGAAFLGQPIVPRVAVGGVLGAAGIALLYSPQIAGGFERGALVGLAFCLAGTLSFCAGNLVSTAIQRRGVPLLAATAWGMTYGVAALAAIVLVRGQPLIVEWTPRYLGATLYLALFASVVAFASYLTLLRRIGAARAGYATVLFPIVALAVSTLVEGYRWTLAAILGAALALAGNVLVLRR
ncbi:MAG TPA: DMT family transporter [Beijerinckiaceae bacterium]|nr:DMT family transporter [Beijerinckiaceae bacterium]